MGRITSSVGLISGINTTDIINQLIQLEQQPKTLLQGRKDKVSAQKDAYTSIKTALASLQTVGRAFERPSTFTASTAQSSDENVLTATTGPGASVGSFQFQVARLVTSQQSVSSGFSDANAAVTAGTLTVELGGGNLDARTDLAQLNGGAGVRRGLFRITDRSGKASVIDTTAAVTLDDVVRKINSSLDVSVKAAISGDKLVLTDSTGLTASKFKVEDIAGGFAAADLGIVGNLAATTITGTDVNYLGDGLSLGFLNDGRGVRLNATGPDLVVRARDGSQTNVTIGTAAKTVGDVIKAINAAGAGKFKASVATGGNGITLTNLTGGAGAFSVTEASPTSHTAADLGLLKSVASSTLGGGPLLAGLGSVLISSLKGGGGLPLGKISITDRAGTTKTVDLTAAASVQDVLDTINSTAGLKVAASLKASGNGIQVADTSGGAGNLVISDVNSTTAAALGISGTFDTTRPAAVGTNLQLQWVNENSLLSRYNGGKGVTPGVFTITNSAGTNVDINLATGTFNTLGDVIGAINTAGAGVTASINANGDGLLLTDTAGGAGKLSVANKTGTTATDLNIASTAATPGSGGAIDGSFEKTIDVTAGDTLTTVQGKIRDLAFGASASVINDGSGQSPYRLSLAAFNGGKAGRVVFDAGTTGLDTRNLVDGQDAAVFLGGTGSGSSSQPLLLTSNTNQIANIIPGVTIDLHGVSNGPVSLNVTRDPDSVVDQVKQFVDGFNGVVDTITGLTGFDTDKQQAGLLLGDGTIQQVQSQIYVAFQGVVKGAGRYRVLADVGVTVGDGAKLSFDEDKFRAAFATDPEAVKNLFAQSASAGESAATPLSQLNGGKGVSVAAGAGAGGPDFRITTHDGGAFDVTVNPAGSLADVISAISTATGGKATAAVSADGKGLSLTDNTTGAGVLSVGALNGSLAASGLGIDGRTVINTLAGKPVLGSSNGTGIGYLIDQSLKALVDPVDGVISRENNTLDDRAQQFQDRMDALDKLIQDKKDRLERQFANMETVLAGLQSQQQALGSLSSVSSGAK